MIIVTKFPLLPSELASAIASLCWLSLSLPPPRRLCATHESTLTGPRRFAGPPRAPTLPALNSVPRVQELPLRRASLSLQCRCFSGTGESPGVLLKCSFRSRRSGVRPEHLPFELIPSEADTVGPWTALPAVLVRPQAPQGGDPGCLLPCGRPSSQPLARGGCPADPGPTAWERRPRSWGAGTSSVARPHLQNA